MESLMLSTYAETSPNGNLVPNLIVVSASPSKGMQSICNYLVSTGEVNLLDRPLSFPREKT